MLGEKYNRMAHYFIMPDFCDIWFQSQGFKDRFYIGTYWKFCLIFWEIRKIILGSSINYVTALGRAGVRDLWRAIRFLGSFYEEKKWRFLPWHFCFRPLYYRPKSCQICMKFFWKRPIFRNILSMGRFLEKLRVFFVYGNILGCLKRPESRCFWGRKFDMKERISTCTWYRLGTPPRLKICDF